MKLQDTPQVAVDAAEVELGNFGYNVGGDCAVWVAHAVLTAMIEGPGIKTDLEREMLDALRLAYAALKNPSPVTRARPGEKTIAEKRIEARAAIRALIQKVA